MSNRTRTLIIGATLTAMNLVGMTAVAQAQANDQPSGRQAARRPPTERQVGEPWRHRQATSQEQTAADAALQRVQAQERFSIPNATPTQVPAPASTEPSGQPGRLFASLAVLVTTLALAGGLVVLAAKRTRRRARLEHGLSPVLPPEPGPAARWGCRAHPAAHHQPPPDISRCQADPGATDGRGLTPVAHRRPPGAQAATVPLVLEAGADRRSHDHR